MALPLVRLVKAARKRGLSQTNPVPLTTDGINGRINVIVSYAEPTNEIAPLDLVWIDPETLVVRRRVSRAQSADFTHTWQDADETTFYQRQTWDEPIPADEKLQELDRNIGNPHDLLLDEDLGGVPIAGAQMTGPLLPRVVADTAEYAPEEAVPRSFVEVITKAAQNLAVTVYQQLLSLRNSIRNLQGRMTTVEQKVQDITVGEGLPTFNYTQAEAALQWQIKHSLNTANLQVVVRNADGELMLPDIQRSVDADNLLVTFAEERAGYATIVGVR